MLYSAILKSLVSKYAVYAFQVLSLMLLARLFSPKQFGVIASVQVVLIFFQMISEAGFGPAIIGLKNIIHEEISGIFTLTILVGAICALVFLSMSKIIEQFYSDPQIRTIVPFAAGSLFFYSASIVPIALLNRDMKFFSLGSANAVGEILSTGAVLLFRQFIDPLSALASKSLISIASQFFFLLVLSWRAEDSRRLSLVLNFRGVKQIIWFSKYQFSFSIVNYFSRNFDNISVGKFLGASALGIYDKAYQLMKYPLMLLTFGMTPAIQPALSRHRGDGKAIEQIHRDFTFKLFWLGSAAGLLVFLGAPWIVKILLGPRWILVVPIIRALALSIPIQVVMSTSGSFFQAIERPDLLFFSGLIASIMVVAAIIVGVRIGDLVVMSWLISTAIDLSFFSCYLLLYGYAFKISPLLFFRKLRLQLALTLGLWFVGSPFASKFFSFV